MVTVFLADGFEEIEALTCVDILRRGGVEVVTAGVGGKSITGSHGVIVTADTTVEECPQGAEMLILPGGGLGTKNLGNSTAVRDMLTEAKERRAYIAAICAAPTVLGRFGLLEGKLAVCYPGMEDGLTGAKVCFDRVCADDWIITSRAAGTTSDFAFVLLKLLKGEETAEKVKAAMLF